MALNTIKIINNGIFYDNIKCQIKNVGLSVLIGFAPILLYFGFNLLSDGNTETLWQLLCETVAQRDIFIVELSIIVAGLCSNKITKQELKLYTYIRRLCYCNLAYTIAAYNWYVGERTLSLSKSFIYIIITILISFTVAIISCYIPKRERCRR